MSLATNPGALETVIFTIHAYTPKVMLIKTNVTTVYKKFLRLISFWQHENWILVFFFFCQYLSSMSLHSNVSLPKQALLTVPAFRYFPKMVTLVPPDLGPWVGVMSVISGSWIKMEQTWQLCCIKKKKINSLAILLTLYYSTKWKFILNKVHFASFF